LISSLITFKRDIRRIIYKKVKQSKHLIYKIIIIECPTYEKMIEENDDYYCPSARKTDSTILIDILWWDNIYSRSQISSELTEK